MEMPLLPLVCAGYLATRRHHTQQAPLLTRDIGNYESQHASRPRRPDYPPHNAPPALFWPPPASALWRPWRGSAATPSRRPSRGGLAVIRVRGVKAPGRAAGAGAPCGGASARALRGRGRGLLCPWARPRWRNPRMAGPRAERAGRARAVAAPSPRSTTTARTPSSGEGRPFAPVPLGSRGAWPRRPGSGGGCPREPGTALPCPSSSPLTLPQSEGWREGPRDPGAARPCPEPASSVVQPPPLASASSPDLAQKSFRKASPYLAVHAWRCPRSWYPLTGLMRWQVVFCSPSTWRSCRAAATLYFVPRLRAPGGVEVLPIFSCALPGQLLDPCAAHA